MTARPVNPMGCGLCGIDQRSHAIQTGADGSHAWTRPTEQQVKDRMLARQADRVAPVADAPEDEPVCRAGQYVSVPESYNGSALCGCLDCIEYVAERESEDEV
ncbi:hypothetical protein [Streptomyces sp. NPDC058398]|uniref:hypothetical protein n=1 Tax=Streptomyces sp. NPDC058398 TaxID=3346479 RepID=UPI00364796A4